MSDDLRDAIANVPRHVKFPVYDERDEPDGVGVRYLTGKELADAILARPEMVARERVIAAARAVVFDFDARPDDPNPALRNLVAALDALEGS